MNWKVIKKIVYMYVLNISMSNIECKLLSFFLANRQENNVVKKHLILVIMD